MGISPSGGWPPGRAGTAEHPNLRQERMRASRRRYLHVFSAGSVEIERLLLLLDRLRDDPAERQLYEQTKRQLARRTWKYVQDYADAKSQVIEAIIARARAGASTR